MEAAWENEGASGGVQINEVLIVWERERVHVCITRIPSTFVWLRFWEGSFVVGMERSSGQSYGRLVTADSRCQFFSSSSPMYCSPWTHPTTETFLKRTANPWNQLNLYQKPRPICCRNLLRNSQQTQERFSSSIRSLKLLHNSCVEQKVLRNLFCQQHV